MIDNQRRTLKGTENFVEDGAHVSAGNKDCCITFDDGRGLPSYRFDGADEDAAKGSLPVSSHLACKRL